MRRAATNCSSRRSTTAKRSCSRPSVMAGRGDATRHPRFFRPHDATRSATIAGVPPAWSPSMTRATWMIPLLLGFLLAVITALPAAGASTTVIRLGSHGAARLTTGVPNTVYVNLKALSDGSWAEALYAGSCTRLGTRIVALPTLHVSGGIVRRTDTLTSRQAAAARNGVIRVARGRSIVCASFARPQPSGTPTPTPTATATPSADP